MPSQVGPGGNPGTGGIANDAPAGAVDGVNKAFVFSGPPIIVFRNGVNETRLGVISGSTFTFTNAPILGDDIEGLV